MVLAIEFEKLRAGTDASNSDSGSEVARKINANFDKTASVIKEVEGKVDGYISEDDLLILDGNPIE